jgi:hypothetical protein
VSGKWRALTRSNIETGERGRTNLLPNLAAYIGSQLFAVITIAGYQNAAQVATSLMEESRDGLQLIANSVAELKEAIAEKVTSCDMDVLFCSCGTSFDPMGMTDDFNSGRKRSKPSSGGLVLCTTNLGLSLTRSTKKDRNTEHEDADVVNVLLKPRVALQSVVNDLIVS